MLICWRITTEKCSLYLRSSYRVILSVFAVSLLWSCSIKKPEKKEIELISIPDHFPAPLNQNAYNTLTKEGISLGKKLFFDPLLSRHNNVSCASCHQQPAAFADRGNSKSLGTNDSLTNRNSPALFNLQWQDRFLWDGGAPNLERQVINPLTGELEMDQDLAELIDELGSDEEYPGLFEAAFGTDSIHTDLIFRAIAQFEKTLISADSKYDSFIRGKANLTPQEERGMSLFMNTPEKGGVSCANCHTPPLFSDFSFRNNGLDSVSKDAGRGIITNNPEDSGKFKVPSLRNLSFSMPYMHDGRFYTLEEVLEHYSSGIKQHANLDPGLKHMRALSDEEKDALTAFLLALNDTNFSVASQHAPTF